MLRSLWLRSFAHRWLGRRGARACSPRAVVSSRQRVRLCLEALEDRITPSMFTPTTFADDGSADSLRGAITQANNDTGTATDTIQLQAGSYALSIPNSGNIHEQENASGDLNITNTSHALVIQGVTDASGKPTTIIDQTVADRVFQIVNAGTTVTFKNVIIEGGTAQDDGSEGAAAGSTGALGGGILDDAGNVTLTNVVLQSNSADGGQYNTAFGGGIYEVSGGSLTLNYSVIQNNTAYGGLHGGGGYQGAVGGGIALYNDSNSSSTTVLTACTISGNSAIGGATGFAIGGGVGFFSPNSADVIQFVNSTIVDNNTYVPEIAADATKEASFGGGVALEAGTATFTNVTVADNTSIFSKGLGNSFGGGIGNLDAHVTLVNTLVASNSADNSPDYSGPVSNDSGHNLIGNAYGSIGFSAAHGDLLGAPANPLDPQLGPLTDNSGPTQTVALLPGSPAIDAGDNSAQSVTGSFDQRGNGFARVVNGTVDIGAFEVQTPTDSTPPTITTITTPSVSSTYNSTIPQTVTLSAGVAASNGSPVNEGNVTFTVTGTSLTATGIVTGGTATATLTLPAGFDAGTYSFAASYTDNNANYSSSTSTSGTLTVNQATVTITPLNIANAINTSHTTQVVTLAANVASANGGTVNEGVVTFTVINPNGSNLTATGSVSNGAATATLTLPAGFASGTYVYLVGYVDPNNGNSVPNYAANGGAGTVDPPAGNDTATFTVENAPVGGGATPSPAPPTTLQTPPLLAFFDAMLGGIETVNGNGTETVTERFFGMPLFISTYDGAGNLRSVTLFGIDITRWIELL